MFACAHPAIEAGVRAPLMLAGGARTGCGDDRLGVPHVSGDHGPATRARQEQDQQAGIPFRIPEREELAGRLDAVLDAIYAAFAEGWTDPGGTDVVRRDLAEEAFFLASS